MDEEIGIEAAQFPVKDFRCSVVVRGEGGRIYVEGDIQYCIQ
jgi:hypothetical protein